MTHAPLSQTLVLENCALGVPTCERMRALTKLQRLNYSQCAIGDGLAHLGSLRALTHLQVSSKPDILEDDAQGSFQIRDADFEHLVGLRRLRLLELNGQTSVTIGGLQRLSVLSSLSKLTLGECYNVNRDLLPGVLSQIVWELID